MARAIFTTKKLDEVFNYPHKSYPTIHVSGTNGKGSTSSMLASILTEAGYKVGLFNTPSFRTWNDMIKINGVPIPQLRYDEIFNDVKNNALKNAVYNVSGMLAMTAFIYFQQEKVDIAVFESDLGAATDSTGVLTPIVSLLTNITPDHLDRFGDDFIKYAIEKIGVIKQDTPIYVGETPTNDEVRNLLCNKAKECNANLVLTDSKENNLIHQENESGHYNTIFGDITISLGGNYQSHNLNLVLNVVKELRTQGYNISDVHIISGLNRIYENTGLCGRWQLLNSKPQIILDCGHNINAWEKIVPQLLSMKYDNLYIITQMCHDKDVNKITKIFPDEENITYIFPASPIRRLINPNCLMHKTRWMGHAKRYTSLSIHSCLTRLCNKLKENDIVFIGGTCKNLHTVIDEINDIKQKKEW